MEILKSISAVLKKLVGISAFLVALSETIIFLDKKIDDAITKKEDNKDASN